ncbi:MAG: hypothetical protein J6Y55_10180 [Bacteroidales bacterium]|nr:hypothetical protein [Bacteroidales bacterium]
MKWRDNILEKILLTILVVILVIPITNVVPFRSLHGVVSEREKPMFTLSGFKDGSYQKDLEKYVNMTYNGREAAVRIYNQFIWTFFHKTNVENIVIGKENWLFEPQHVEDYYQSRMYKYTDDFVAMKKKLTTNAKRLFFVQEILKEYGKTIFVMIEPGKERFYSQYLPENTYTKEKGVVASDYYAYLFDSLHVNCFNTLRWFEQIQDSVSFPLFPQTGTHWSNIAATYVLDSLIRYMEFVGNVNMQNVVIDSIYTAKIKEPDADLEELLNIEFPIASTKMKYANLRLLPDSAAERPRLITIGDSYFWNLSYQIPLKNIFSGYPYWYYNKTIYFDKDYNSTDDINLVEQIMNSDFIMLSYCTAQIYDLGNSFISRALVNLCYDDEYVASIIEKIQKSMLTDSSWKASLQKKAEAQNVPLEQILRTDAEYVLYNDLDKYFPEIASDTVPKLRNKRINEILEIQENYKDVPKLASIIHSIYLSPSWLQSIKEKADTSALTFEDFVKREALWVYENR